MKRFLNRTQTALSTEETPTVAYEKVSGQIWLVLWPGVSEELDNGADASAKAANVANTDVEEFPNWTADTPVSSTREEKRI